MQPTVTHPTKTVDLHHIGKKGNSEREFKPLPKAEV